MQQMEVLTAVLLCLILSYVIVLIVLSKPLDPTFYKMGQPGLFLLIFVLFSYSFTEIV